MPRSANSTSAADKMASRVPVDLSERAIPSAVIASVNTARPFKSSNLFSGHGARRAMRKAAASESPARQGDFIAPTPGPGRPRNTVSV